MSYIVVEGLDLAGKTTLIKQLNQYLKLRITKEPFEETLHASKIRGLVQSHFTPPIYETQLLIASRIECLTKFKHYLDPNSSMHLISDRNFISNMVYQSTTDEEMERIFKLNQLSLELYHLPIIPHVIIYIDIPYEEALKRYETALTENREITGKDKHVIKEKTYNDYRAKYKKALDFIVKQDPSVRIITIKSEYDIVSLSKVVAKHLDDISYIKNNTSRVERLSK